MSFPGAWNLTRSIFLDRLLYATRRSNLYKKSSSIEFSQGWRNSSLHSKQVSSLVVERRMMWYFFVQLFIFQKQKRENKGCLILKIDLEKDYDILEWDFARTTLFNFKVPSKLIWTIMSGTTTSWVNVLVNGGKHDSFAPSRGMRKGDPISLYIFILCMEYLAFLIDHIVLNKKWKGIKVNRGSLPLIHLLFSYDIIMTVEESDLNWNIINIMLKRFYELLGQKVNPA